MNNDDWYEELMNAQLELSDAQGRRFTAALVLLLANHIAEPQALRGCLRAARAVATEENA